MTTLPGPLDDRTAGPLTAWSVGDQVLVTDKWSASLKPALVMAENPARPNVVKVKYLESRTAAWVDRARVRRRRHGQQSAPPAPATAEPAAVVEPDDQVVALPAVLDGSAGGALALLDERARHYAADAVPDSTRRAYQSDVRQFAAWCQLHGLQALPATPATLCRYLAALADQGAKVSTIRRKLSALAQAHRAAGVEPPPTQDHSVRQLVRALRRSLGVAPAQKSPLVVDELRRVVHALPDTLAGRRDRALLLVGLAGAFRRSEVVALDIADVDYERDGLVIRVRRSKTDQEGAGRNVAIPYGSHPDTCPVRALEAWEDAREAARQQGDTCRALFRGVNRHDQLRPGRLSGHAVAELVKRRVARAGLDAAAYSGHSLRAGHVTSADEGGAPESATMRQTGHRSAATLRSYVRHGSLFRQNSAAYLGL